MKRLNILLATTALLLTAAARGQDISFILLAVETPSPEEVTTLAPDPDATLGDNPAGEPYFIEVWVSDVGATNTGITSAYLDLHWTPGTLSVDSISFASMFNLLPSGTAGPNGIDELGASTVSIAGVAPSWVRLALLAVTSFEGTALVTVSPSATGVAAYGRGLIPWSQITYNSFSTWHWPDCNDNNYPDSFDITLGFLTDSLIDHATESQGALGWFYGYYAVPGDALSFTPLTSVGHSCNLSPDEIDTWMKPGGGLPHIYPEGHRPARPPEGPAQWAVRRWVSETTVGSTRISFWFAKHTCPFLPWACGDGIRGHVIVDGVELWATTIDALDDAGVHAEVIADLSVGSSVDLAISPLGSDACDWGLFEARISPPGLADCNGNQLPDDCDIASGFAQDCNSNGAPDSCDITAGVDTDCNANGVPDGCDLAGGGPDVNGNGVLDACETDCNANGQPDAWEVAQGLVPDCNGNGVPDACDIAGGAPDLNGNGIIDACEDIRIRVLARQAAGAGDTTNSLPASAPSVALGASYVIEIWASDVGATNTGVSSAYIDLAWTAGMATAAAVSHGTIFTTVPTGTIDNPAATVDELGGSTFAVAGIEPQWARVAVVTLTADVPGPVTYTLAASTTGVAAWGRGTIPWSLVALDAVTTEQGADCNGNGVADGLDIANGTSLDCDANGVPDECDLAGGAPDCNQNGIPDACDIAAGASEDGNGNGVPDECEQPISVAGRVATPQGAGVAGVELCGTVSGACTTTGPDGTYALLVPFGTAETVTPCGPGWNCDPPQRSYGALLEPRVGEDYSAIFVYDVDPPSTGDDWVGIGDLSRFALSWSQAVPPADPRHDFDCNGFVGVSDLSLLASAWLKSVFDGSIIVPVCQGCGVAVNPPGRVGDDRVLDAARHGDEATAPVAR